VQGDPHLFVFDANKINTLVIGRGDPGSGEKPDIDVNGFGEEASGVSRRHASIMWVEGALHIVDNNSSNGTYVDERRIEADKPYILHDGDNVRLGELVLHVRLTAADSAESPSAGAP
jgi:pSer/pThr/pTyr-binding forkhead associated (FHA) protein